MFLFVPIYRQETFFALIFVDKMNTFNFEVDEPQQQKSTPMPLLSTKNKKTEARQQKIEQKVANESSNEF